MNDEDQKALREMRQSTPIGRLHDDLVQKQMDRRSNPIQNPKWKGPIPAPLNDQYPTVVTLLAWSYMQNGDPADAELLCELILRVGNDDYEEMQEQIRENEPQTAEAVREALG
jgi:hypothetical protein